jgi:hypothetical protein
MAKFTPSKRTRKSMEFSTALRGKLKERRITKVNDEGFISG